MIEINTSADVEYLRKESRKFVITFVLFYCLFFRFVSIKIPLEKTRFVRCKTLCETVRDANAVHVIYFCVTLFKKNDFKQIMLLDQPDLLMETGPPFYVVIEATRRSSHLQCKGVPSFLSYCKIINNGAAPAIEPATSRFAVKRALQTELILPRLAIVSNKLQNKNSVSLEEIEALFINQTWSKIVKD